MRGCWWMTLSEVVGEDNLCNVDRVSLFVRLILSGSITKTSKF
jgi:hypothetical protein